MQCKLFTIIKGNTLYLFIFEWLNTSLCNQWCFAVWCALIFTSRVVLSLMSLQLAIFPRLSWPYNLVYGRFFDSSGYGEMYHLGLCQHRCVDKWFLCLVHQSNRVLWVCHWFVRGNNIDSVSAWCNPMQSQKYDRRCLLYVLYLCFGLVSVDNHIVLYCV